MKQKKKSQDSEKEKTRFKFNLQEIEKTKLGFLDLGCEFFDIYISIQKNLKPEEKVNKKQRRKSIQKVLRSSFLQEKKSSPKKLETMEKIKENKIEKPCPAEMSFMIESEAYNSNLNSMTNFIKESLEPQGLDTTIAFMSSEDEGDEEDIQGFTQQINSEFLRKDLYEIWKDFNEISILLFCKNLKDCVLEYRKDSEKFFDENFKSSYFKKVKLRTQDTGLTNLSNRILSDSIHLDSPHLKRFSSIKPKGKETQMNIELAKMYRKQHGNEKDKWIEYLFWGFLGSSVFILVLFFVLFYCNVFSSSD